MRRMTYSVNTSNKERTMYFDTKTIAGGIEILASNDYQAVPLALTETDMVNAGMPITQAGKAAKDGSNAIGILLYDIDPKRNPNAAVVVDGIVDWGKCKKSSGATATAEAMARILPNITFREDGKTYVFTASGN